VLPIGFRQIAFIELDKSEAAASWRPLLFQ